ncbi:hypothetical protein [Agrobacterium rosae]
MHKINVSSVIKSHLNTLSDNGRFMRDDLLLFYLLPFLIGASVVLMRWEVPEKALELSISVFSIFAALLLSVQVAMYGVALRGITQPDDPKKAKHFKELKANRDLLLKELNSNISYLILLSVITVTVTLVLFFLTPPRIYGSGIAICLYLHFFLTLLMVIKRSSIVFSREYESQI